MEDREYLLHIERAIREIDTYTAGMSRDDYERDTKTQRAVERNLQIIGDILQEDLPRLREAVDQVMARKPGEA